MRMPTNNITGIGGAFLAPKVANKYGGTATPRNAQGYFWKGADGKVYVQGGNGSINAAGNWDSNTAAYWGSKGFSQTADSAPAKANAPTDQNKNKNKNNYSGGGGGAAAKVLDTAQLSSLDSLIASLGTIKDQAKQKAAIKRDTATREKAEEKAREEGKYKGKKLGVLQEFAGAKTDTDLNTRNTLENLVSSLSTLGLGGSRALSRQILDAANMSNRKANATQSTNNRDLDGAWNEYTVGNQNDVKKIQDQYGYDAGEAERAYLQQKQNALYKKADIYNAADKGGERQQLMDEGNSLNGAISGAAFMNPQYTGEARAMATPELGDYTQDIAKYDTTNIGGGEAVDGANVPGNLAVKAMAVNDKDLGIKKKSESDLGYGV